MDAVAHSAGPHQAGHDAQPPLSAEEFARFCSFFYRHTGILFGEQKRYFVERRIQDRIRVTRSEGFRDYFSLMRFDTAGQELQHLGYRHAHHRVACGHLGQSGG